jgi:hypothetical protein
MFSMNGMKDSGQRMNAKLVFTHRSSDRGLCRVCVYSQNAIIINAEYEIGEKNSLYF